MSDELEIVARLDAGRVNKVEKTASGGLRIGGNVTRVGVFVYHNADGSVRRELRHPEEVFSEDSLASLRGAPVTVGHPSVPVNTENWSKLAVGHIGDDVKADGRFVDASVLVQDGKAVARVGSKQLPELSCGYVCSYDPTPGVFEGQAYDGVQRNVRYNHVALLPKGQARGGSEVALRIDGKDAAYPVDMAQENVAEERNDALEIATLRADKADKARDVEAARADAAESELAKVRAELAASREPAAIDAIVGKRFVKIDDARKVLGADWKHDGKTDEEIDAEVLAAKVVAISASNPDFKADSKSPEYVAALYDFTLAHAAKVATANAAVNASTVVKADAADKPAEVSARAKFMAAQTDRSK